MTAVPALAAGREAGFVAGYFAAYVAYLFLHQEGELLHWVSLVLLPLAVIMAIGRYGSLPALLRSIGFLRPVTRRNLWWLLALCAVFQVIQLVNVRQREALLAVLREPLGFLVPVGALVLLVGTVATTEEVFFRGIMQSRLADWFRSEAAALVLTTLAFILYHVPYAYLSPGWPSHGDVLAAVRLAAANGVLGGLALGWAYWRSGRNLAVVILLHACIDLVPATRLVHSLLTGGT